MGLARRLQFHNVLKEVLGSDNVYFQPPENQIIPYPCIVYERDNDSVKHADNRPYRKTQRYQVTYIDHLPDSDVIDALRDMTMSEFSRHFATSGLNHDVFVIYY